MPRLHLSASAHALLATGVTTALVLTTSGCNISLATSPPPSASPNQTTVAVIVAGNHANSPAPRLSERSAEVVAQVMRVDGKLSVISASGDPGPLDDNALRLRQVKGTEAGKASIIKANLKHLDQAIQRSPEADGADTWGAIHQAAGEIDAARGQHPVLVVADSGLADHGSLDFTVEGMLGAEPKEVVAHLRSIHALPNLTGVTAYLQGLGYTAPPQVPLSPGQRSRVVAIYRALLMASGARVVVDGSAGGGDSVSTNGHTVHLVTVPAEPEPKLCSRSELVFTSQSAVSFVGDRSVFVNKAAAHAALAPVARWLAAKPARRATIRGTTANARSLAWQKRLGLRRAQQVKAYLVSHGVQPSQVRTLGLGSDFPEYVQPDRDARGELLPGPASVNRSVRVTTEDAC